MLNLTDYKEKSWLHYSLLKYINSEPATFRAVQQATVGVREQNENV